MRWHQKLKDLLPLRPTRKHCRPKQRVLLQIEELETRALLSAGSITLAQPATTPASDEAAHPLLSVSPQSNSGGGHTQQTSSTISGYTPKQIQQAYGVNTLLNQGANGKGETIAVVDAYNDPNVISDANKFSSQFNLPLFNNSSGGPTLKVVSSGGGSASSLSQNADWALETSLDVEWAHAIAPEANILLVEAADESDSSLFSAVQYAAAQSGVVAVSMSWGDYEFSGETSYDSYFVPPSNNPGVAFVAASGDSGAYSGPLYPATSPYVLAVGGTTLSTTTNSSGGTVYGSETAWSYSGGGAAAYEGEPSYQYNQQSIDNTYGFPNVEVYNYFTGAVSYYYSRMTPDVAYNADPNTGYAIYDSVAAPDYGFSGGWGEVGGTSAGAPQWSALVALADQQRVAAGEQPLDTNQVQNQLYNSLSNGNYANIFHDITAGSNGYFAGPGYDIVTGLGSPIANNLVPYLAGTTIPLGQLPTIQGSGYGSTTGTTSAGFGTTTFFSSTSFYGFSASAQPGGGLYNGTGSLSIPPASAGANGLNGTSGAAAAAVLPQPGASLLPPFANSLTFAINTVEVATALPATGENNFLGQVATLMPGSTVTAAGSSTQTPPTFSPAARSDNVFGASGWNGSALSWPRSELDLPIPAIVPQAESPPDDLQYVDDQGRGDDLGADYSYFGENLSQYDFAGPARQEEGDNGDGGDG